MSNSNLESLLLEQERRTKYNKFKSLFPDTGKYRRDLYPKHINFIKMGSQFKERCLMSGNRVGKTVVGAYEMACHLTGIYPEWWPGKVFDKPINAWAIGKTAKTTRDIVQQELMGDSADIGTGLIKQDLILHSTSLAGTPGAFDTVRIKHISGGTSILHFKSSDQGDEAFYGAAVDVCWIDEESPVSVYMHCLTRTMTTKGIVYLTFTPEKGLSELVLLFLKDAMVVEGPITKTKHVTRIMWDEVPHLSTEEKEALLEALPPHMKMAKSRGIPAVGVGAVYPVDQDDYTIDPFDIRTNHYPRVFAMDFGWNKTAVLWGAYDKQSDTVYIYDEWYRGQSEPEIHAAAIKARGKWIDGVCDPSGGGTNQENGRHLRNIYDDLGLTMYSANNSVEAGIVSVYSRLSTGRIKIFKNCQNLLAEMRIYRYDDNGKIVKKNDHLCDCLRYLIMSGLDYLCDEPNDNNNDSHSRTVTNSLTGY